MISVDNTLMFMEHHSISIGIKDIQTNLIIFGKLTRSASLIPLLSENHVGHLLSMGCFHNLSTMASINTRLKLGIVSWKNCNTSITISRLSSTTQFRLALRLCYDCLKANIVSHASIRVVSCQTGRLSDVGMKCQ